MIEAARSGGAVLAVPVERSGREWPELEWGQDWLEHATAIRPDFAKVLVRDNPAFSRELRDRQRGSLRQVTTNAHGGQGHPVSRRGTEVTTPREHGKAGCG